METITIKNRQEGFGIVEILVSLGLVAVMVLSIVQVIDSVYRLQRSSNFKTKAIAYAQMPLEIINDNKNLFSCDCVNDTCSGDPQICTSSTDGQSCQPFEDYDICWTYYPVGQVGHNRFYLDKVGSDWNLYNLAAGVEETIPSDSNYTRVLIIENIERDTLGDMVESGGTTDPNTKKIKSIVYWQERGEKRSYTLETIITLWKNL
ncbi:hypothetical protein KKA15_02250 [Patescibacteria group bacterium]|nr:hypothetical protein [Patescibacteria group bacterium]